MSPAGRLTVAVRKLDSSTGSFQDLWGTNMRSSYLAPDPAFQFMGTAGQCLLFQDPGDSEGDVPCWAVMPAILIMNYSWDRLMELDDRALSK